MLNHMVEYTINIDTVFSSLADATRRDILRLVLKHPHSIGELAEHYTHMTFAAVAKHITVLETARLVVKVRQGRQQIISGNPQTVAVAVRTLEQYQALFDARFATLDTLLKK
jgi:DNA-binding transcriptional ArsR family regulator